MAMFFTRILTLTFEFDIVSYSLVKKNTKEKSQKDLLQRVL